MCLTYGIGVVWVSNYAFELPMSSWRSGWETTDTFTEALGASLQYLVFFSILSNAAMAIIPSTKGRLTDDLGPSYRFPVAILGGISALALIASAGSQSRDQYALDADIGSKFVVQASSIMLAAVFAFALFYLPRGTYRTLLSAALVTVALATGLNGFRFILILFAFIYLFHMLVTKRISARRLVMLALAAATGYFLLLVIAYTRAAGMTFTEAISFAANPDVNAALQYVGASDQTNMVAQDYYLKSDSWLVGRTYIDAFLRLAPNVVHSSLFETIRSQDYIIDTGAFIPDAFRRGNLTIGSHLFVEAIVNFGKIGPYIMLSVFGFVIALIERNARRSPAFFLGYVVLASMGYSLAWYGFTNTLKQGLFAFICCWILFWSGKLAQSKSKAAPPTGTLG